MSTKTTFVILGTLFIGIIIGILGGGIIHQQRIEQFDRMRRMNPEQRFAEVIDEIIKPDEKQRAQIKEIMDDQTDKITRIDDDYRSEILAMFDSTRKKINSLLTEDQIISLEKHLARGHKRFYRGRIERLSRSLELTEEQQRKIEEIFRDFDPPIDHERGLLPGRKNRKPPEFNKHNDEIDQMIRSLLTPEQLKKYSRLRRRQGEERRNRRPNGFPPPFKEKPPQRDNE